MILFPAIDIKNKQCVRLIQGDFNQMTIYHKAPVEVAKAFESEGATFLHIIDLDGAKQGEQINLEVITAIAKTLSIPIQVGGGIRTIDSAKSLLDVGVSRVIIGSMAIDAFDVLESLVQKYPNQVIVSIDAKQRKVATQGWQHQTSIPVEQLIKKLESIGIDTIVYTDIDKDGMLQGPNIEDYKFLSSITKMNVIASGGVTTLQDIKSLNDIGLYGAIIGKSIYEGKITVKEALSCLQNASSHV
jgi:phosphoribosylformimino-5-aminoimidazole carboxamide ribotide isomerase